MTAEFEYPGPARTTPLRSWPALSALMLLVLLALYAVFNLTHSVPLTAQNSASNRTFFAVEPGVIKEQLYALQTLSQTNTETRLDPAVTTAHTDTIRAQLNVLLTPSRTDNTYLLWQKLKRDLDQMEQAIASNEAGRTELQTTLGGMLRSLDHVISMQTIHQDTALVSAQQRAQIRQQYGRWAMVLLGLLMLGLIALAFQQRRAFKHRSSDTSNRETLKHAIEGLPDGCIVLDPERRVAAHNTSMLKLLPNSADNLDGTYAESLYSRICHDSTQTRDELDDWLTNLSEDSTSAIEVLDHRNRHLLIRERPTRNGEITTIIRDISDIKEAQRRLQQATDFDALTGLPNRALFMRSLRRYTRESDQSVALIVCDLRDFRQINDSFGQHAGDQLLISIGQCLKETMPSEATIARISGDEFAVMIHPVADKKQVESATQAFLTKLESGLPAERETLPVRASVGISYGPEHGVSPVELKNTADSACAQAKREGSNHFAIFDRKQQEFAEREHAINIGLAQAVKDNEFQIEYQPQIDIATNLTSGMEALVRWNSESLGRVSPAEFIPLAEKSGLIVELGTWVLNKAIEDYLLLTSVGMSPGALSVNISRRQFDNPDLVASIEKILHDTGMKPELLTLEITETAILDNRDHAEDVLHTLSSFGTNLSIDDFGVGYSSLLELRDFPINEVKIDRMFVKDVVQCQNSRKIIQAIVNVADAIGAEVVAEGIENREQFECIRELGCDRAQGFFLCEPMTATTFPDVVLGGGSTSSNIVV